MGLSLGTFKFLGRGVKMAAPIAAGAATLADLAAPVSEFAYHLGILFGLAMVITGAPWFGKYRKSALKKLQAGEIVKDEYRIYADKNPWSIGFSFSLIGAVAMWSVVGAQSAFASKGKGVLATNIPKIGSLQAVIFKIHGDLEGIKEELKDISKGDKYDFQELTALKEQDSWEELLLHLEDIPPKSRNAEWFALLEEGALAQTTLIQKSKGTAKAYDYLNNTYQKHPQLKQSTDAKLVSMNLSFELAIGCYKSKSASDCYGKLEGFSKRFPHATQHNWRAGKTAGKHHLRRAALPFFKNATKRKKTYCKDEDLWLAIESGLGIPPDTTLFADLKTIVHDHCWNVMKDKLATYMKSASGYPETNSCQLLKEKGAISRKIATLRGC